MLTDEEAWQTLAPFLSLGVLKTRQVASMLKAPLARRGDLYQMLIAEAYQTREAMRRICAECGKREGEQGMGKLKQCGKCANIWYCSRDCQLANFHSGVHKQACTALKIARICRENEGIRSQYEEQWLNKYLVGLHRESIMTWPEGHIPEGWTAFFETRGISQQASANNSSGMALSEVLHEGLTIALAAKKFGLLGREGGKEGWETKKRPFRLHVLGATETEEARRLHLTMGELYKLLYPYYYEGLEVSLFGPQLTSLTTFRVPLKGFEGGKEGGEEGGRVTVEKSNLLYHDWVLRHGGGTAPKPDLVVAFNSGAYTGNDHQEIDGSMWLPTLAYIIKARLPLLLTMYDALEGKKTVDVLQANYKEDFCANIIWGPELNPMRSLVLEETEPPALQRYAKMVMNGVMAAGEEEPEDRELAKLDLSLCNRTAGNSRFWIGVQGEKDKEGGGKGKGGGK
ncbi:hypothetical protein VYU27_003383 [Nannochloropsis oceanica]